LTDDLPDSFDRRIRRLPCDSVAAAT